MNRAGAELLLRPAGGHVLAGTRTPALGSPLVPGATAALHHMIIGVTDRDGAVRWFVDLLELRLCSRGHGHLLEVLTAPLHRRPRGLPAGLTQPSAAGSSGRKLHVSRAGAAA
ncbi:hypothetical protein [Modestobacter marinus]|uniref:hypothetical protein n=1 Tax=Modestobacter marinus TaxID=477641 RepID=UPI001C960ECE|nr:hypothetical protein [Modestobacter marinus]